MPASGKLRLREEQVCVAQDNTANSTHSRQWGQASTETAAEQGAQLILTATEKRLGQQRVTRELMSG